MGADTSEFGSQAPTFRGKPLPNWETDPITSQHRLAKAPPDLLDLSRAVVAEAGRGSPLVALERFFLFVGGQADDYALKTLPDVDLKSIRETLCQRDDFEIRMLFDYLTYFGPAGIAMNNGLVEHIDVFHAALVEAARGGHLEREVEQQEPQDGHISPFPKGEGTRDLESFPGPGPVANHLVSLIGAAGLTFAVAGRCTPQAIHDEFLRLLPVCRESAVHDLGIGTIFGNVYLSWATISDGEVSMALYPGVPDHPEMNPRAREVFDLAFDNMSTCGPEFYHTVLLNGEADAGEVDWIEKADFVPLQWLTPWNEKLRDFDPSQSSDDSREIIGAIMNEVMPIYESDNSDELRQWIPKITKLCRLVTREDPRLIRFVQDLYGTATQASVAERVNSQSGTLLSEQGWAQLIAALNATFPGIDLAGGRNSQDLWMGESYGLLVPLRYL